MIKTLVKVITTAVLLTTLIPTESATARDSSQNDESSPYIVGTWKFVTNGGAPIIDTEFSFINPTNLALTLEYAFFEADTGEFCGCDRDDFSPNKTTVYTVFNEKTNTPNPLFTCKGTRGALKSIVFRQKGDRIFIDDARQLGFQIHVFGNVSEGDITTGNVMTESGMKGVSIDDATREEIEKIHQQCKNFLPK